MTSSRRRVTTRTISTAVATAVLTGGLVLVSSTASAAPQDCSYMGYNSAPDQLGLKWDANEQWVADTINAYRVQNGRAALQESSALARPTMWGALDSANRGFSPSDHIDSRGMGPQERAEFCSDTGYPAGTTLGEINYFGSGGTAADPYYYGSGPAAFDWWKNSPTHNALMLGTQFTHFSVGWSYLGVNAEQGFWVVMFGTS
jgi:uncharacterized protein YkwD